MIAYADAAKSPCIVLLGPPASGKGTQGRRLAASLGLGYLSTGALLREQVELGTVLGKQAEVILARGEYLPDNLMCPILADWLANQCGGWVLDGFPRSLPQARFLDDWLTQRGMKIAVAVSLEVPLTQLMARIRQRVECPACRWSGQQQQLMADRRCPACKNLAGPRADDDEQNFRSRYAAFSSFTQAVIEHYRHLGCLYSCDATAAQDQVAAQLLQFFPACSV